VLSEDVRVLLAPAVVLCFLYFTVYAAGLVGLQSFGVAAMEQQFGVAATFASSALTAYMLGSAAGILAGGFIATHTSRHDAVAMGGLAAGAAAILVVATGSIPGVALPAVLAGAGFAVGITGPSRDLIVRAATPAGATGKVYGFVYSGLDVGSLATPVLYGWLMDARLPEGVFYLVFGLTALAILTVVQLSGRAQPSAQSL
jgi:MFS family permease